MKILWHHTVIKNDEWVITFYTWISTVKLEIIFAIHYHSLERESELGRSYICKAVTLYAMYITADLTKIELFNSFYLIGKSKIKWLSARGFWDRRPKQVCRLGLYICTALTWAETLLSCHSYEMRILDFICIYIFHHINRFINGNPWSPLFPPHSHLPWWRDKKYCKMP